MKASIFRVFDHFANSSTNYHFFDTYLILSYQKGEENCLPDVSILTRELYAPLLTHALFLGCTACACSVRKNWYCYSSSDLKIPNVRWCMSKKVCKFLKTGCKRWKLVNFFRLLTFPIFFIQVTWILIQITYNHKGHCNSISLRSCIYMYAMFNNNVFDPSLPSYSCWLTSQ